MSSAILVTGDDWAAVSRTSLMLFRRGFSTISAGPGTDLVGVARDCDPHFVVEVRGPDHVQHDAMAVEPDQPQTVLYQRVVSFDGIPTDRSDTFAALTGALAELGTNADISDGRLRIGDLELDAEAHLVTVAGEAVELAATPFELLRILMRHADQVLSKPQLLELMYGYDGHSDNLIEAHISTIRRAIDITYPHIETVRGIGYVIRSTPATPAGRDPGTGRAPSSPHRSLALVSAFPTPQTNDPGTVWDSPPPPEADGWSRSMTGG